MSLKQAYLLDELTELGVVLPEGWIFEGVYCFQYSKSLGYLKTWNFVFRMPSGIDVLCSDYRQIQQDLIESLGKLGIKAHKIEMVDINECRELPLLQYCSDVIKNWPSTMDRAEADRWMAGYQAALKLGYIDTTTFVSKGDR